MGANSSLIFGIIMNVAILLVFFRFLMQLAEVGAYNPVVMATVKATRIVDVFSRILPTLAKGRVNLAALTLVVVLYLMKIFGVMYLSHMMPNSAVHLLILTFVTMIQDLITFCRYLIFNKIRREITIKEEAFVQKLLLKGQVLPFCLGVIPYLAL